MAYDQGLAQRLREALEEQPNVVEKAMFGGLAFLLHGNMCIGIIHDDLMVRVGPEAHAAALARPHARPMDFAKRPMVGYVYVAPEGIESDTALAEWVSRAVRFAETLPPKEAKPERGPKGAGAVKGKAATPKAKAAVKATRKR
jgi:TfoX/Sxy family transcriptional regulator of competence genes